MSTAVYVLAIVMSVLTGLAVAALFVWGAMKDGEANEAIQARIRLGIRRLPRRPG